MTFTPVSRRVWDEIAAAWACTSPLPWLCRNFGHDYPDSPAAPVGERMTRDEWIEHARQIIEWGERVYADSPRVAGWTPTVRIPAATLLELLGEAAS